MSHRPGSALWDPAATFLAASCTSAATHSSKSDCSNAERTSTSLLLSLYNRGRSDDNLDVIKRRFYSYEHETAEVLKHLREKVESLTGCEVVPD